ncbi:MAG: RagB/SusD family nutrient uptake outer membrane protein [Chitinophagaceae bacterium]|nr:RagB/SusD family nutrient uptake outer membrane protein [Chitinophagaceae bacterium]
MKKNTIFTIQKGLLRSTVSTFALTALLGLQACKKDLEVNNPNSPTVGGNVTNESGIAAYAKGTVYWNGFNYGNGWLGDSYFSLPWGYIELMGDVVGGGQGSNNQTTTMGVPDRFQADPADATTVFTNPSPQVSIIRSFNTQAASSNANNALIYQWTSNYALINAANLIVENLGNVSGLSVDKANTIKAWAAWWKGYAYSQIGSLYYAGLIIDKSNTVVNTYVDKNAIIAESNRNLSAAATLLNGISNQGDYAAMIAQLIPKQNQVGLGMPPTSAQWVRIINTMLARNIVLNKLAPFVNGSLTASISKSSTTAMTNADWQSVITLCNNGIRSGDYVFTGRSSAANSFFSASGGTVASLAAISNQNSTYKVSERLVQQFKSNDKRLANFSTTNGTFFGDANTNSTRYTLVDGVTAGLSGIPIFGSRQAGGIEIYLSPTYEENTLMLAEANIRLGNVPVALTQIDAVRSAQGSGVSTLTGLPLTAAQAMTELTMERLAALAFRGLSYYDLRRWGWTYSIANGGGRYGCNVIFRNTLYTNATFNYNYMDYWDVPADELVKNPPAASSAVVKNPNY